MSKGNRRYAGQLACARMSPRTPLAALAALIVILALPAPAMAAKTNIAVGIGDQSAEMFDNASFRALRLKKARYFIRWNAIDNPGLIAQADAWVNAARRRGVRPLFH